MHNNSKTYTKRRCTNTTEIATQYLATKKIIGGVFLILTNRSHLKIVSPIAEGIPAILLKTCAPELALILNKLFQLSYTLGTFPTSWKQFHVFPISKKATRLIHSTIVPLQSLYSSLKQWRPSSLNNFLPS